MELAPPPPGCDGKLGLCGKKKREIKPASPVRSINVTIYPGAGVPRMDGLVQDPLTEVLNFWKLHILKGLLIFGEGNIFEGLKFGGTLNTEKNGKHGTSHVHENFK